MREKYESLSLAVLKELAKSRGLKGISTLKKAALVERMLQEDEKEAQKKIHSMDKKRDSYFGYYAGQDWKACHTYDLAISTSALGIDKAVDLICQYIELKFK